MGTNGKHQQSTEHNSMIFWGKGFAYGIVVVLVTIILLVPFSVNAAITSSSESVSLVGYDSDEVNESSVNTKLIEVDPPAGWERTHQQEPGMFNGCYVYTRNDPLQDTESVAVLACMMKGQQESCEQVEKDAEPGTVRRIGKALYSTSSDTHLLLCVPAREGKEEALFAVMAEDAFRKYEARDMLAAFTHFEIPPVDLAPGPDLPSYLPSSLAGEEVNAQWGGLQRIYKTATDGAFEALVVVLPYYPHWGDISQCLRSFRGYFGELTADGKAWKSESAQPGYVALSHDERALLVLRCADEDSARKYKAAFDKFRW